jgi:hypothetical protein
MMGDSLSRSPKVLRDYLKQLKASRKEKPAQVKESLGIYVGLWEQAIKKGIVAEDDDIDEALTKVGARGGLYQAVSGSSPSEGSVERG